MRFGVMTIAYNEERFIKACVNQFLGLPIEQHLVLVSETPWHGPQLPPDNTDRIARDFGAVVVKGSWASEAEQRNFAMNWLSDMDWVLVVDADELYVKASLENLLEYLSGPAEFPAYGIGRLKTYWKNTDMVIRPEESGGLIVAAKPGVNFVDKRCIDSAWSFLPPSIIMHHLSYVRTDEEMLKKIQAFEHFDEIVPGWYENVWQAWRPGMVDIHPVSPPSFSQAKLAPLPESLKELL